MSDEQDPQEEYVARLLATAGAEPDPMPEDVATRLDDVLAGLVAERSRQPAATAVTDLASRRRRWPRILAAAAAVSVLGVGLGSLVDDFGTVTSREMVTADDAAGGRAEAGAAGDGAAASSEAAESNEGYSAGGGEKEATDEQSAPDRAHSSLTTDDLARLRPGSLTVDIQRIEDFALAAPLAQSGRLPATLCVRPSTARGDEWLRVRFQDERGVLVLRAPDGGRRTAEVFTCEDAVTPAASVTIDAR